MKVAEPKAASLYLQNPSSEIAPSDKAGALLDYVFRSNGGDHRLATFSAGQDRGNAELQIARTTVAQPLVHILRAMEEAQKFVRGEQTVRMDRVRLGSSTNMVSLFVDHAIKAFEKLSVSDPEDRDRYRVLLCALDRLDRTLIDTGDFGSSAEAEKLSAKITALVESPFGRAMMAYGQEKLGPIATELDRRGLHDASSRVFADLARLFGEPELAELSTKQLGKRARMSLEALIARGGELIPEDVLKLARETKVSGLAAKDALAVAQTDKTGEAGDRAREAFKKHEQNLARLSEKMLVLRTGLIEGSGIGEDEAKLLAETLLFGAGIKEEERPALRQTLALVIRLTEGRGLGSLFEIARSKEKADAGETDINVGADTSSLIDLLHEWGHHLGRRHEEQLRSFVENRDDAGSFYRPYAAHVYHDGSTEVASTGLETFDHPDLMARLIMLDEEHFKLVLGLLRS